MNLSRQARQHSPKNKFMEKKIHEPFEAGKAALALCVCAIVCVCVFVREDGTYENTFHGKRRHSTDAGEGFDELVVRV